VALLYTNTLKKQKGTVNRCEMVFLNIALAIIITMSGLMISAVNIYAVGETARTQSFDINNFKIRNFGIDSHNNLFVNVLGQAGGSKPSNPEQLFSYIINTNNGAYAISSSEEPSKYGAAKITLDQNNCITSSHDVGQIDLRGNTFTLQNVPVQTVYRVNAVQFNIDDSATCIASVFDSKER
jgi:hypothetical protein